MRRLARCNRSLIVAGFILLCILLWAWYAVGISPGLVSAEDPPTSAEVLRKIEPELLRYLLAKPDDLRAVMVEMQAPSALPQATTLTSLNRLARRQLVVKALKSSADLTQASLLRSLATAQSAGQVTHVKPFWVTNGVALTGRQTAILEIAQRDDVQAIRPDRIIHVQDYFEPRAEMASMQPSDTGDVEWNIRQIRADQVWNALGIDGRGAVVGSLDTGVDWLHPALFANYRGNAGTVTVDHATSWFCATDEGFATPTDSFGHGTHTMGTMVGQMPEHPAIGVAPGAHWIAAKIFNDRGEAYLSWIHAGFQWMLDPGGTGDPRLAPDVVNNSWGSISPDDTTFQQDVQALRAAGIVPIFSAGNSGPQHWTIESPGSFPESMAVGASDSNDYVTGFSSRGPSPWLETKPDVTAPGLRVNSAAPGGGYAIHSGTSMAAPHVAGLVALLLQANPVLSVAQIETLLTSTAVQRGAPIPNDDYGWGRIDALQAVAATANPAELIGVVQRIDTASNVPYAQIEASALPPHAGFGHTVADASGGYDLPLASGSYIVTASAFGYYPATAQGVTLPVYGTTLQNFDLAPLPTGQLIGQISELGTGRPLSATITISGTPVSVVSNPETGAFGVDLPEGTYEIVVISRGHRVGQAHNISVSVGNVTQQDFQLAAAPTILLVDSGAWYNGSQAAYFRAALDALDYNYDVWAIHNIYGTNRDVPTAADLRPYSVVIWSCPADSPGYVNAWPALTSYLDGGGKLFLTGQGIGSWDNPKGAFRSTAYTTYLRARFLTGIPGSVTLRGLPGSCLQSLELSLNGADSAHNQLDPDSIALSDEATAMPLLQYDGGYLGGLTRGTCLRSRIVYLSFGFEGITGEAVRREVMDRILGWFVAPPTPVAAQITPSQQAAIQAAGQSITYTVYVLNHNAMAAADTYRLSLTGQTWPTTLSTDTITVGPCFTGTVTIRVDVPVDAEWHATDTMSITAQSMLSPTVQTTAVISTHTPAPILLVDHDRWYHVESTYKAALDQAGLQYDYWDVGWNVGDALGPPPEDMLRIHPIIVWFTGYDWAYPLTADDESRLTGALSHGSRLLLVSPDYFAVRDLNDFGREYLGVDSYDPYLLTTEATGVTGDRLGNTLGPYTLNNPFPQNNSEVVTPTLTAHAAFFGSHDHSIAVHNEGPGFRTAFFSFPIEAISSATDRREVMRQAVGELSWLGGTTFTADQSAVEPGATIAFTLTVPNNGPQPVSAAVSNTLPDGLTFVPGSLSPPDATYDSGSRRVGWSRPLPSGDELTIRYLASVSSSLPTATRMINSVQIGYSEHQIEFDRFWVLDVGSPDLSGSQMVANPELVRLHEPLTYTIVLRNDGLSAVASATLTNPIPSGTTYLTASVELAGSGTISGTDELIRWDGALASSEQATVTFQVLVTGAGLDSVIQNVAYLRDGYHPVRRLRASTNVAVLNQWLPRLKKRSSR